MSRRFASRRNLVLVGTLLVCVVLAAAAYLLFFTPSSPERLQLSPGAGQAEAVGGAIDGTWRPAEGSTVGYRVRERFAGVPAASDAVGRTTAVTGSVTLRREGDRVTASDARFTADLTQLRSDESRRDNRLRTLGLETDRFPTATFASPGPIDVPAGALSGQAVKVPVSGDLTIHGVTKRVTVPLEVQPKGARVEVVGALTFPFSDFGMEAPNIGGFVSVEADPTLELKLVLERAG